MSDDGFSREQFLRDGQRALEWIADYLERLDELPVLAQVEPGALRRALPPVAPEPSEPFGAVLDDLDRLILPALTHWQHPRFFAYFPSAATEAGILAELLSAALNQVGFVWRSSPALTELELHVMTWLRQLLGLGEAWHGHIEDTASISTLAALIAARHTTGRRVVVASEHAHSSIEKGVRMLDLELRRVGCDARFAMREDALAAAIAPGDVAAVVATVGTTSSAAVDPVAAAAEQARSAGAWVHVDAAYAGTAWVCPELRWSQDGVAAADSLVVNPHKWMAVPMDCSTFWTTRPEQVRDAFTLVPEYLRTQDDAEQLSDYGPALGRRFRALKLWAVLRCTGRDALQERIREHVRLAERFAGWVEAAPGWSLAAPCRFSLVCFRRDADDAENERIMHAVNASGAAFLSHTKLDGRYVLRMAIGNPRTSEEDVELAWALLRSVAGDGGAPPMAVGPGRR